MADKFLNLTAVQVFKTWATGLFALDTDLDTLAARVEEIIAEGGEPNVIETVKVNGTALTPTDKAVNVVVPTKTSDITNDGDGQSNFATEEYVDTNGGKIDVIKVNGTTQTITNKTVDLTVPTKTSDLTNDSDFQTDTDVDTAITTALANGSDPYLTDSEVEAKIKSEVSGVYKPQGAVAFANLPTLSANIEGYVYNVTDAFTTTADFVEGAGHSHPAGTNVVCVEHGTGTYKWDCLSGAIDLSAYWTSTSGEANTLEAATVAEINAILNA